MPYNIDVEVGIMGVYYFSNKQVEELKRNPFVKNVSYKAITYEEEFKELFITDYQNGLAPSVIFKKYGFDTRTLGRERIHSFTNRVKKQMNRPEGFTDTRKGNSGRPVTKDLSDKEIIERLKQQNEILKQENDFLKRIRFINRVQISKASKTKPQEKNTD